jgi:hypothetical protein
LVRHELARVSTLRHPFSGEPTVAIPLSAPSLAVP